MASKKNNASESGKALTASGVRKVHEAADALRDAAATAIERLQRALRVAFAARKLARPGVSREDVLSILCVAVEECRNAENLLYNPRRIGAFRIATGYTREIADKRIARAAELGIEFEAVERESIPYTPPEERPEKEEVESLTADSVAKLLKATEMPAES